LRLILSEAGPSGDLNLLDNIYDPLAGREQVEEKVQARGVR
jgi:hypothetical protein